MKKAIVLGATGGMGYALVNELVSKGIETVAFARTREKLSSLFVESELLKFHTGNVFQQDELTEACKDADVIFHAINIPYYEWAEKQPVLLGNILTAAQLSGAKLVVVDNIYAYGRQADKQVDETAEKLPHTKKGKIRLQLIDMVKHAQQAGVQAIIAHFPDFYGPFADNTILHQTFQPMVNNKTALFVGRQSIPREYIYTPDGAKALSELALRDEAYGQEWNIPGAGVISGKEIIEICRNLTGYKKRVWTIGRGLLFAAGLFDPMLREVMEMMYLTEEPVVLSGKKYESLIGPLPITPYAEGIRWTIESLQNRAGQQTLTSI